MIPCCRETWLDGLGFIIAYNGRLLCVPMHETSLEKLLLLLSYTSACGLLSIGQGLLLRGYFCAA